MLVARRALCKRRSSKPFPTDGTPRRSPPLRCYRGIDTLSASGLCAEVGDWRRFRPKQLAGLLAIVPNEHTSDLRRRHGSITRAGASHARRLLVEAAHQYRHLQPPPLPNATSTNRATRSGGRVTIVRTVAA